MKHKHHKSGFSIIEVVLVLAIAGLIFAMVFIALPSLNQHQRNTQRKRDAAALATAMQQWYTHNTSSVSDNYSARNDNRKGFCTFYKRYVGKELNDPSTGMPYKVALWGSTNVIDCISGDTENRGSYDSEVHGSGGFGDDDNWALMQVGDIQYDDGAFCEDEAFNDNIGDGKYAGLKIFAFRVRLEGGATICVDNGYSFQK